jgi:hypothetical protein
MPALGSFPDLDAHKREVSVVPINGHHQLGGARPKGCHGQTSIDSGQPLLNLGAISPDQGRVLRSQWDRVPGAGLPSSLKRSVRFGPR